VTERRILPNRRDSQLIDFEHDGIRYTVGASRFDDGRLGEIFIDCERRGSAAETASRDGAVLASLALQHGVSVDVLRHALTQTRDGSPAGPVGVALRLAMEAA